jgi:hypothetical protein
MNSDYRYRVILERNVVARVIAKSIRGISYPNFKNKVLERQGIKRHDVYSDVWMDLRNLTKDCG